MTFLVLALLTGLSLPPGEDWAIVGSHEEAVIAIDRTTVRRSGSRVHATVLMAMFRPETPPGTAHSMQYYRSDESVDCAARERFEHEVRIYSPDDALLGTSPPDPDTSIGEGSMYQRVYDTLCGEGASIAGDGYASPLEVIRAEAEQRRATGRAVKD